MWLRKALLLGQNSFFPPPSQNVCSSNIFKQLSQVLVSWPLLGREGWREAAYGLIYQREVLSFKKGVGAG